MFGIGSIIQRRQIYKKSFVLLIFTNTINLNHRFLCLYRTIGDALKAAEDGAELERQEKIRQEERRQRLERRRRERKINKPLINSVPLDSGPGTTCHDRVCVLTLLQLKQSLRKYLPNIQSRFNNLRYDTAADVDVVSCGEVINLLQQEFYQFLYSEYRKIEKATVLSVEGKCLGICSEDKNLLEEAGLMEMDSKIVNPPLSGVLTVSRKQTNKREFALKCKFDDVNGILHLNRKEDMEASVNKKKSSSSFSAKRRIEDEVKCCPRKEIGRKMRKRNVLDYISAVEEYREDDCEGGRIQKTNFSIGSKSAVEECMKNLKSFKQDIHVIVENTESGTSKNFYASHKNKEY